MRAQVEVGVLVHALLAVLLGNARLHVRIVVVNQHAEVSARKRGVPPHGVHRGPVHVQHEFRCVYVELPQIYIHGLTGAVEVKGRQVLIHGMFVVVFTKWVEIVLRHVWLSHMAKKKTQRLASQSSFQIVIHFIFG